MSESSIPQLPGTRESRRLVSLGRALVALGGHLERHPELTVPTISSDHVSHRLPSVADALAWAKTLNDVDVSVLAKYGCRVLVQGSTPTHELISLSAEDAGDLVRWHDSTRSEGWTLITVDQLAAYVAAGSVDLVHEHLAVTR